MIGLSAAPAGWVMVAVRPRTPNRAAVVCASRCCFRASVVLLLPLPSHAKRGVLPKRLTSSSGSLQLSRSCNTGLLSHW